MGSISMDDMNYKNISTFLQSNSTRMGLINLSDAEIRISRENYVNAMAAD